MLADSSIAALIDSRASAGQKEFLAAAGQVAARLRTPVYLVGGAVRDLLATGELRDIDLVVEGDGIELARQLASQVDGSFRAHDRFLTAEVFRENIRADVVTARTEVYDQPAVLPRVSVGLLKDDLSRRDFTINSMAFGLWPEAPTVLIDPFSGQHDLNAELLRVLHDQSFLDDPTRILRGVRLGSRLGMEMEPWTLALAVEAVKSGAFEPLSATRLRQELILLLEEPEVEESLRRLEAIGFMAFMGLTKRLEPDAWRTIRRLSDQRSKLEATSDSRLQARWWLVYLMAISLDAPISSRAEMARRLHLDEDLGRALVKIPERLEKAVAMLSGAEVHPHMVRQVLDALSSEEIALLLATEEGVTRTRLHDWFDSLRHVELNISGTDLVGAGFSPGPDIGQALEATLDARVDGLIESSQELQFAVEELTRDDQDRTSE